MKRNKNNFLLLLCLVLFSAYLLTVLISSSLLAKYASENDSNDSTTVAEFNLDVTLSDNATMTEFDASYEYNFKPGLEKAIDINLDATDNEVEVKCTVTFELVTILPLEIYYEGVEVSTTGITTVIAPGDVVNFDDITISWNKENNSYLYSGAVSLIKVNVLIEQVE